MTLPGDVLATISNGYAQSVIYGIGTMGLALTYRYLKFPDFTILVSMIAGAIMSGYCINSILNTAPGMPGFIIVLIGLFSGVLVGALMGFITFLQIKFVQVPPTIAGITTSIGGLYIPWAVNKNSNIVEIGALIPKVSQWLSTAPSNGNKLFFTIIALIVAGMIALFFKSRYGMYALAMLGDDGYVKQRHHKSNTARLYLLAISNGVVGLAGALLILNNKTFDISTSTPDFLYKALCSYAFALFLVHLLTRSTRRYFSKKDMKVDDKPFRQILTAIIHLLDGKEEDVGKIFTTQVLYVVASVVICSLFFYVELYENQSVALTNLLKGIIVLTTMFLLAVPALVANFYEKHRDS